MPIILLKPTERWRRNILVIPTYGSVTKPPLGKMLRISNERAAQWLVVNKYCEFLDPEEDTPCTEEAQRQVIIAEDSSLSLEPPVVTSIPGNGEQVLIDFFSNATPGEINKAIRTIGIKTAEELKAVEALAWDDILRILTEKQMDAAVKWVAMQE